MHDIFLSYAAADRSSASQLAEALDKLGWKVWWDRTILPGKTFDKVIESELNAATCVIVLWSATSVESQWVRAEAGEALDKNRLIPVLLEGIEIPLVFRQIQAASLLDWDGDLDHAGFIQLTRAISTFVTPSPASEAPDNKSTTTEPVAAVEPTPPNEPPETADESARPPAPETPTRRLSAILWPVATATAFFIAGLSVYLNQQEPVDTEPRVSSDLPAETVIQAKRDDKNETIAAARKPNPVTLAKTQPAIKTDTQPSPMNQTGKPPLSPRVTTSPRPDTTVTPPKPAPAEPARTPRSTTVAPPAIPAKTEPADTVAITAPPKPVVPESPPVPVRILMVIWATPNDNGLASPASTRTYSDQLAQLMSEQMKGAISGPVEFNSRYIKDTDHHSLMRDRPKFKQNSELCSETGVDLVVIGFVEGAEFDDMIGFLPTRNPFFSAFHCASGKGAAKRYEVAETLGDSFPFEQSLNRVFRSFSQKELAGVADL